MRRSRTCHCDSLFYFAVLINCTATASHGNSAFTGAESSRQGAWLGGLGLPPPHTHSGVTHRVWFRRTWGFSAAVNSSFRPWPLAAWHLTQEGSGGCVPVSRPMMGARRPGDGAARRVSGLQEGWRSLQRGAIPHDCTSVPINSRAAQIRQKLPGQTGYDPTFPPLPESSGPPSPDAHLKCIFPLMMGRHR